MYCSVVAITFLRPMSIGFLFCFSSFSHTHTHTVIPFVPCIYPSLRRPIVSSSHYTFRFFFFFCNSQQTLYTIKFRSKTCNVAQGNKQRKFNPLYCVPLELAHSWKCICVCVCCLRICQRHFSSLSFHSSIHSPERENMFKQ